MCAHVRVNLWRMQASRHPRLALHGQLHERHGCMHEQHSVGEALGGIKHIAPKISMSAQVHHRAVWFAGMAGTFACNGTYLPKCACSPTTCACSPTADDVKSIANLDAFGSSEACLIQIQREIVPRETASGKRGASQSRHRAHTALRYVLDSTDETSTYQRVLSGISAESLGLRGWRVLS